jgi:hypothetical protein
MDQVNATNHPRPLVYPENVLVGVRLPGRQGRESTLRVRKPRWGTGDELCVGWRVLDHPLQGGHFAAFTGEFYTKARRSAVWYGSVRADVEVRQHAIPASPAPPAAEKCFAGQEQSFPRNGLH